MRGNVADVGTRRVSPNGYTYEKTPYGWETVQRLVMEQHLGRPLSDNEYVCFLNGDKTDFDITNLLLRQRGRSSLERRIAALEAKKTEIEEVLKDLYERRRIQKELLGE